jgi:hypothetical protein
VGRTALAEEVARMERSASRCRRRSAR